MITTPLPFSLYFAACPWHYVYLVGSVGVKRCHRVATLNYIQVLIVVVVVIVVDIVVYVQDKGQKAGGKGGKIQGLLATDYGPWRAGPLFARPLWSIHEWHHLPSLPLGTLHPLFKKVYNCYGQAGFLFYLLTYMGVFDLAFVSNVLPQLPADCYEWGLL